MIHLSLSMKSFLYHTMVIGIIISTFPLSSHAASPNGLFGEYFTRMTGPCASGYVLTGFSNTPGSSYGAQTCKSLTSLLAMVYPSSSSTAPTGQAVVGFNTDGTLKFGDINWIRSGNNISYNDGSVGIGNTTLYPDGNIVNTAKTTSATLGLANGFEIQQGGSNYGQFNSWVHLNGYHGFYSTYNSAHFYPNNASYGSWKIDGQRNGWGGIEFAGTVGNISLMMNSDSVGFYNPSYGWKFNVSGGNAYVYDSTYGGGAARRLIRDGDSSLTLSANTPTAADHVATKAYVDSAVSAAGGGGGLKVYRSDGVTVVGYFLGYEAPVDPLRPGLLCSRILYSSLAGVQMPASSVTCGAFGNNQETPEEVNNFYFADTNCSSNKGYIIPANTQRYALCGYNGTNRASVMCSFMTRASQTDYKIGTISGDVAFASDSLNEPDIKISRWNHATNTCEPITFTRQQLRDMNVTTPSYDLYGNEIPMAAGYAKMVDLTTATCGAGACLIKP